MSTEENLRSKEHQQAALPAPVEMPPGTAQVAHHCPVLEEEGYTEISTYVVDLFESEPPDGWRYGRCLHCSQRFKARF